MDRDLLVAVKTLGLAIQLPRAYFDRVAEAREELANIKSSPEVERVRCLLNATKAIEDRVESEHRTIRVLAEKARIMQEEKRTIMDITNHVKLFQVDKDGKAVMPSFAGCTVIVAKAEALMAAALMAKLAPAAEPAQKVIDLKAPETPKPAETPKAEKAEEKPAQKTEPVVRASRYRPDNKTREQIAFDIASYIHKHDKGEGVRSADVKIYYRLADMDWFQVSNRAVAEGWITRQGMGRGAVWRKTKKAPKAPATVS